MISPIGKRVLGLSETPVKLMQKLCHQNIYHYWINSTANGIPAMNDRE
jgi:hypothetical protein